MSVSENPKRFSSILLIKSKAEMNDFLTGNAKFHKATKEEEHLIY